MTTQIKENLCDCHEVVGKGTFAASGALFYAANPGLLIEGIGKIGLPLSDRGAEGICRICHEAPSGKGSETLVDLTGRKSWELNLNQFNLRNYC